jgi:aminomethyltransferase
MPVDCAVEGTALQVKNSSGLIDCTAAPMPFYDVDKERRTAKG